MAASLPTGYINEPASYLPQTLKTFSDATNVTYADSGTAATQSLDASSPFGSTRLRVDCPSGNTYTEVALHSGVSIASVPDGTSFYFRLWVDDWNAISQIQVFAGTTSYTRLVQNTFNMQNSDTNNRNGPITIWLNSLVSTTNTLTWGSDTIAQLKIRVFTRSSYSCRFWVDSFGIGYKSRTKIVLTFDDASQSWIDYVKPYLSTKGLRATFAVNSGDVGTNNSLYVDAADLRSLQTDGHDIQSHNVTNTAYSFTSASLAAYLDEYDECIDALKGWGITNDFMYHAFVQGKHDQLLIDGLRARGVKVMRGVDSNSATTCQINQPGCGTYSDNLVSLKVGSHGASLSLANARTNLTNLKKYGGTYFAMLHDITTGVASGSQWTRTDFEAWIDDVAAGQAAGQWDVMPVSEWYLGLTQPALAAA